MKRWDELTRAEQLAERTKKALRHRWIRKALSVIGIRVDPFTAREVAIFKEPLNQLTSRMYEAKFPKLYASKPWPAIEKSWKESHSACAVCGGDLSDHIHTAAFNNEFSSMPPMTYLNSRATYVPVPGCDLCVTHDRMDGGPCDFHFALQLGEKMRGN